MIIEDVPHLATSLSGPLLVLEAALLDRQPLIEAWLRQRWLETPAPFYTSVDLRNSGFKLAPVDTNLFPAGFNNLNSAFMPLCIQSAQTAIERVCPTARKLLLIPESHTRNPFYFESLATLQSILTSAGLEVRLGSLREDLTSPEEFSLASGRSLIIEQIQRDEDVLQVNGFIPCAILLNNDLSSGVPDILKGIAQTIIPPLELGWASRRKSDHFAHYQRVAQEFAEIINIDPWLINPLFRHCGKIDFMKREGEACLARNVGALLSAIQDKYDEYGLKEKPFVCVKADSGTYGMGIMMVQSQEEVLELNRKQRTKMAASKGGQSVTQVILQEGVYTFETFGPQQSVAEPVIYMIDRFVVGGFYRVHKERGPTENLNAPGMHFEPLAFSNPCNTPDQKQSPDAGPNRFYAYGVIARLALLAAAREIAAVSPAEASA
ncbi:MAG: glutamate--cysteine ligase [Gammaproteobacteria bacterium]|nr:glutamate--cysteine ligase [Gammaproteobacteria bacterium]